MLTLPSESDEVLSLAACLELSENSRLGFAGKVNLQEPGLLLVNLQSTLGMHVSLRETRGGSRIQTWNRYAYVANNPLSNVDPNGLKCQPTRLPVAVTDKNGKHSIVWEPYILGACGDDLFGLPGLWSIGGGLLSGGGTWDGSGDGLGDGSSGQNGSSSDTCDSFICYFFSGTYSGGSWNATQANNWETQYFFQNTKLPDGSSAWSYLPQNQNPMAQAAISLSNHVAQIGGSGGFGPPSPSVPGPSSYPAPSCPTAPNTEVCNIFPPGPERQACVKNLSQISRCQTLPPL